LIISSPLRGEESFLLRRKCKLGRRVGRGDHRGMQRT